VRRDRAITPGDSPTDTALPLQATDQNMQTDTGRLYTILHP